MTVIKTFSSVIFISVLFLSCLQEEDINYSDCNTTEENVNWIRERFNSSHTIMFPVNYEGGITQHKIGTTFDKRRSDEKIVVNGGFCHEAAIPCLASDFKGEEINIELDSIAFSNNSDVFLNRKITIRKNQVDIGYFYYNDELGGTFRNSYGQIYLLDINDLTFKLAGKISFVSCELNEIISILESLIQE